MGLVCHTTGREFPPLRQLRAAGRLVMMDAAFCISLMALKPGLLARFSMLDKV
jgi:hypothetical protein